MTKLTQRLTGDTCSLILKLNCMHHMLRQSQTTWSKIETLHTKIIENMEENTWAVSQRCACKRINDSLAPCGCTIAFPVVRIQNMFFYIRDFLKELLYQSYPNNRKSSLSGHGYFSKLKEGAIHGESSVKCHARKERVSFVTFVKKIQVFQRSLLLLLTLTMTSCQTSTTYRGHKHPLTIVSPGQMIFSLERKYDVFMKETD